MIKTIGFWLGVDVLGFSNVHFHTLVYKNELLPKIINIPTNKKLGTKFNTININRKILPIKNRID